MVGGATFSVSVIGANFTKSDAGNSSVRRDLTRLRSC
jgi:hypothetical protein